MTSEDEWFYREVAQTRTGRPAGPVELRPARPGTRPRVPGPTAAGPPASARLWGLVSLAAALGLLLDSVAVSAAPAHYALAGLLFWPAAVAPNVAFAAVLLSRGLSRGLRHFTIALVGLYSAVVYRMSSPFVPGGFDEHLHERTLSDLLHGSGLFAPNPLLSVSPNYPGLELFTGMVTRLGGLPSAAAAALVVLLCRYLLVLAIYEAARTVNPSPRFASLVVLLYATSPQFFFFNSQFAYQTIAVPLGLGGLLLVRRAQLATGPAARRLLGTGIVVLAATVVAHHVTSWFVFAFLVGWTVLTPRGRRRQLTFAAVGMGLALGIWTGAVFGKTWGYLAPVLAQSAQQATGLLTGSGSGRSPLGGSAAGYVTPDWQRVLLVSYALTYTVGALVLGLILIRRARAGRGLVLGLVGLSALCYPVSLAAHFVPSAASIGDRASTFLFLPLSLAAALVAARDPRVARPRGARQRSPASRGPLLIHGLFPLLIGLAFLGGIVLGAGPTWALLPGSFMVVADSRSQDSQTLAAVRWAGEHLPAGSRIVADRVPADLLAGEARQWPLLGPADGADWASVYFSPQWSSYQSNLLRQAKISYIYVDQRLAGALPNEGYYLYEGETPQPARLTAPDLAKFGGVPGLVAVYRRGPVAIYSTAGLGVRPELSGYAASRRMGLGLAGDAACGVAVALAAYGLRRRLRWAGGVLRSAGAAGGTAAVIAAVIGAGFLLFGLDIVPGPGFSVGAALTSLVLFAVARRRRGESRPIVRPGRFRPDSLVFLAAAIFLVAVAISLRAAWVLDVSDVNGILRGIN